MKKIVLLAFLALSLTSFVEKPTGYTFVNSDNTIKIEFSLNQKKTPSYKVFFKDKLVVNTSELGIIREDANFYTDLKIVSVSKSKPIQSNYSMLQGKRKKIAYAAN
jgi:hypothetical protein